jgi:predicted transcriptional regulator
MKLKKYLSKYGITPLEFAAKCSISLPTVYRLLKGEKGYMSTARLIEMVTNKEVSIEDITGTRSSENTKMIETKNDE